MNSKRTYSLKHPGLHRQRLSNKMGTVVVLLLTIAIAVPGGALAAPSFLDPTFGGDGRVTADLRSEGQSAYAVAVQADGKIVAAGRAWNGTDGDFALARFGQDGSLDTTFGQEGFVVTNFSSKEDLIYDVAVQNDGKIVVAGDAYEVAGSSSNRNFALARYNANGTIDTTFDTDGKVMTDFGSVGESAYSLVIQADGKIVAAGYTGTGVMARWHDTALARYNPNGSLDSTFGTNGKVTSDYFSKDDVANSVLVQTDGKIVTIGHASNPASQTDFAVTRFQANGTLDSGFGVGGAEGDGKVTVDILGGSNLAWSGALQSDGKIVVGGYATVGNFKDFALTRLNDNGTLDSGFGAGGTEGDGRVLTDFFGNIDEILDLAVQKNGKIVAAGSAYEITDSPDDHFALARYNANGTLDTGFGSFGLLTTDFFTRDDIANDVAIQSDGKIVAAGYTESPTTSRDIALARYEGDTSLPTDTTAPTVSIQSPTDGATYYRGQNVKASFSCSDETGGSGIESCNGTVASGTNINTSTAGEKSFSVTAADRAGNTKTSNLTYSVKAPVTYQDNDRKKTDYGYWTYYENASFSGGWSAYSNRRNDSMTFSFTGDSVTWKTHKLPDSGITDVYLDGAKFATYDAYSVTPQYNVTAFTKSELSPGRHTLKLVVTGSKNASSTNYYTEVDRFFVGSTSFQENSSEITFGTWRGFRDASASGGTYRQSSSTTQGAYFYNFTGPYVDVVTAKDPTYGTATVTVYDIETRNVVKTQSVNLNSSVAKWQSTVRVSGLDQEKTYFLKLTSTDGKPVVVDAYRAFSSDTGLASSFTASQDDTAKSGSG